jgi:glycosyltransferase involved in cell wall biosynthesis
MSILYISYDGILEPLGQSQVLAYQEQLAKDFDIILMSFEKPADLNNHELLQSMQERISKTSIKWIARRYHKAPSILATAYDLLAGIVHCSFLVWRYKIKVVHARSYPPALIALFFKKFFGIKFLFDMRGFWADERVDGNIWKKDSQVYRITKSLEKSFIINSDHIISLTNAAVNEMEKFPYLASTSLPISVISTCVDLEKFTPKNKNIDSEPFTLGYLGTVGTWYLFQETVHAFKVFLQINPGGRILIINKGEHQFIRKSLLNQNIPLSSVEILSANHDEIPSLIKKMSASVFFLKPLFSKQAAAPTKLGEFLASGIPCLTNEGVGDMAAILSAGGAGITLPKLDDASIQSGIKELIKLTQQEDIISKCRITAESNFSLTNGIDSYAKIYQSTFK